MSEFVMKICWDDRTREERDCYNPGNDTYAIFDEAERKGRVIRSMTIIRRPKPSPNQLPLFATVR